MLVQSFLTNTKGLLTLGDFHAWLFDTHLCYAVERQACTSLIFFCSPVSAAYKLTYKASFHLEQADFGMPAADDVDAKALASY